LEFAYPFRIHRNGKTAVVREDEHIEQMIEQLLFTTPGERVNRPTFGTGLRRYVFTPLSNELVAATQVLIQGALQQWLGDLIIVSSVESSADDSTLQIRVAYTIRETQRSKVVQFTREV
jgi:phage baseplate assembly protein W